MNGVISSLSETVTIPMMVEQRLERLSRAIGEPLEVLKQEYIKHYQAIAQDPQFTDDEMRHAYAIRSFWVLKVARPPTQEIYFIPIGYVEDRKYKSSGEYVSRIYGIYSKDGKDNWKKATLICRGSTSKLWMEVELFKSYRIKVSMGRENVLWAVPETHFENGVSLNLDIEGKINLLKQIGIKIFTMDKVYKSLSRVVDGYVDEWDLRGFYGIVVNYRSGTRSDGSKWAWYVAMDDTVDPKNNVDEDGNVLPTELTIWVPSTMLRYDKGSWLFFYGTLQRGGDGMPYMNAIGIIPQVAYYLEV